MSMLTHFNKNLYAKALQIIKDAGDLHDVAIDLKRIEQLFSTKPSPEVMQAAQILDNKLRHKYPTINIMINIANNVSVCNTSPTDYKQAPFEFLKTDYYGIICDTLLKKRIVSSIEEFIESRE